MSGRPVSPLVRLVSLAALGSVALNCECDGVTEVTDDPTPSVAYAVIVTGAGTGTGVVKGGAIDCQVSEGATTGTCSQLFTSRGTHTYTLTVEDPSIHVSWDADCSGTAIGSDCVLTDVETNKTVGVRIERVASVVLDPASLTMDLSDDVSEASLEASARTPTDGEILIGDAPPSFQWATADPSVVTVGGPGSSVVVTEVRRGETTVTAEFLGVTGSATVTVIESSPTFTRSLFTAVTDAFGLAFNSAGDLFSGNSGISGGGSAASGHVRKVTPDGVVTDLGEEIPDPDIVIIDEAGAVSTLGAGAVLVGGVFDGLSDLHRITEIAPDGSVTQFLVESSPPALDNPSGFAFLPNNDLLIGNYGNNTVSRLTAGTLELSTFYQDTEATDGMGAVAVLDGVVYAKTGSGKLTALDTDGVVIADDLWPADDPGEPNILAPDVSGAKNFDGGLLVGTTDGRILLMDPADNTFTPVGEFVFEEAIFGMAVSPLDGHLYVSDRGGSVWRIERN